MSHEEMLTTLNCGIGFTLILPPSQIPQATALIHELGFESFDLGEVHP